jgi:tetratricopeptide (TPR) repeat protein
MTPAERRHRLWAPSAAIATGILVVAAVVGYGFRSLGQPTTEELLQAGLVAIHHADQQALQDVHLKLQQLNALGARAILDARSALKRSDFTQAVRLSWYAEHHLAESLPVTSAIRVEAHYAGGQLAEAELAAEQWLAYSPEDPAALRWMAAIQYDLGDMETARAHLLKLIELRPADAQARYLLGIIYHDYERFAEAIESFQGLLKLTNVPDATRLDGTLRLADSQIRLRRYEPAFQSLQDLTDSGVAMARCAECLLAMGESDRARTFLARAVAISPDDVMVLTMQSQLQLDDRDNAAAEQTLSEIIRRDPGNVQAQHRLAQCYRLQGRTEDADRQLQVYERTQQQMLRLAELHREAILYPDDADRRDEIARILMQLGRTEQAHIWKRAAEARRQSTAPPVLRQHDRNPPSAMSRQTRPTTPVEF